MNETLVFYITNIINITNNFVNKTLVSNPLYHRKLFDSEYLFLTLNIIYQSYIRPPLADNFTTLFADIPDKALFGRVPRMSIGEHKSYSF